MKEQFITADTHFGHHNIIRHANRPFKTIEEHDEVIIQNINKLPQGAILHHLGDLTMKKDPREYIQRVRKDIIWEVEYGNHDNIQFLIQLKREGLLKEVRPSYTLQYGNDKIFMAHFPHLRWNCCFHNAYHAFGHEHGNVKNVFGRSADVGVDCNNFEPIHIEDFILKLKERTNTQFYDNAEQ